MEPEKLTILLIEDDAAILKLMEFVFKKDYDVISAENGLIALDKMKETIPDIILCDIMMPEMNGIDFKKSLNEKEDTASIPFIFLTAMSDNETKVKAIEMGVKEYIVKPVRPAEIKEKVRLMLENS